MLHFLGRFIRGLLTGLVIIVVLLAVAIGYLGFTASGNQFLADRVAEQVSTPDMQISLEGVSGLLEGRLHLDQATLADTKGKFAEARDIDVFWTPSELLRLRFHADRIAAEKLSVARAPIKTLPEKPSQAAGSFSLPVEIKVDSFDLPMIALGKAIAGRDTMLGLRGSAQAVADRIALDLNIAEKDRLNATAKASVTYAVNTKRLTVDSSVEEPQGGLLARLLSLPGEPPVEISVKGDGTLDNWTGEIKGAVDSQNVLLMNGSHKLVDGNVHEVALIGGGDIAEFLPPQFRTLFAGETKIDVDTRFAETGLIDIRSGSITNDSFALIANGALDPKGEAKLTGNLMPARDKDSVHLDLPLASGPVSVDLSKASLTLNGAFRKATIDIAADLADLTTPQAQVGKISLTAHSDAFDFGGKTGKLSYQLGAAALDLANPTAAKLVQGPLNLRGTADIKPDVITLAGAELESAKIGGKFSGSFALANQQIAADFNLFLLPQDLLPPSIATKLSGTVGLSGHVSATLPSAFAVQNLQLTSNLMTASGTASLDGDALTANLVADVPDLAPFASQASGKASIAIDASGTVDKPSVIVHVASDEIAFAGKALQAIDATIANPSLDLKQPSAKITLSATYLGQTIKTEAEARLNDGLVAIPSLKTDIGANSLVGALSLDTTFLPSGQIAFDLPDIASLAKLAGQTADGALKGTIDLTAKDGKLAAKISANGPRLTTSGIEITAPSLALQSSDLLTQQMSGHITAEKIASGSNHLDQVALDLALAGKQIDFALDSRFDSGPLTVKGAVLQQDQGLVVKLASFSGTPRQVYVGLAQPTEILVQGGTARLQDLTIAAGDGTIVVNGTAGKLLDLTVKAKDVPVALANSFAKGLDASGHISANATITGKAAKPSIKFDADIAGLETSQTRSAKLPALTISTKGEFADNALTVTATSNVRDQTANAKADVALTDGAVSIPSFTADVGASRFAGALALDRQSQPSGRITFDIPDANALAAIVGQKAEGAVKGAIEIASKDGKTDAKVDATGTIRNQAIKALVEATIDKGALALPSLRIDIGRNLLAGAVTLDEKFLPSGKISFDFPDVALLAAMAGQKAEGSLKGAADINSANGRVDAKVNAQGNLRGQTIDLNADVVSDKGRISLPSLDATIGPNKLSGGITLDAAFLPSGKLDFDFPDLALLASMAGQKAEGAVKGTADISSADKKIDAKLTATGLIRNQAIDIRTDLMSDNGSISIPSLTVNVGKNTLTGALSLDKTFLPSGRLSFDFPDINLLAAFAGQTADGALKGNADLIATNGKISGKVAAAGTTITTDGVQIVHPEMDVTVADLAAGQLSGHVKAEQLSSGANRLDLLVLNFGLADRQTQFDLTGQYDARPLSAAGRLAPGEGGLKLTLSELSAMPRNIPIKLDQPNNIRIKDGAVSIDNLSIALGDGSLVVNGTAGKTLDLTARIEQLPLALANAFAPNLDAKGHLSANIKVSGEASTPAITFDTQIQDFATNQTRSAKLPALAITAKGQFVDNALSVTADTALRDQATHLSANVTLDQGQVAVPTFQATIGRSSFDGTLAFGPKFQPAGHVTFDIPDAGALASVIGQKAEGALKGGADITSENGKIGIRLDADGTVRQQVITALADISLDHGALSLPSLKLDVGANNLNGAITLGADLLPTGKLDFDFPDLALLAAMAGQKAEGALKGTADIASTAGKVDAKVAATGLIRNQAIDINTHIVSDKGAISIPSLGVNVGTNTLTGALSLNKAFLPTGKLSFDFPDIGLLAAFAGQKADGTLKGNADIITTDGKISGKITAIGTTITTNGAQIVHPEVDLTIADLATGQLSGHVKADQLSSGANHLDSLALNFDLVDRQTQFDLSGQYDAHPLSASGQLAQDDGALKLTLSEFSAAPRNVPVKLSQPKDILFRGGVVSLDHLLIALGDGSITVNGTAGKTLDLTAQIDRLPLAIANAFAPGLDAAGLMSANIKVSGDASTPVIAFDTRIADLATSQTRNAKLPALAVTARGQFADNTLSVTADTALRGQPTHLSANVKLDDDQVAVPTFTATIGKSSFGGALGFDWKFQPAGHVTFDIPDAGALAAIVEQKAEGALKGRADITSRDGKIGIKLDADGTVRQQAIKALADVSLDHGAVSLPSLTLDVGKNRLNGAITLGTDFLPTGKVDFDLPDLALLAAMAGQKAEGALKGAADITSTAGKIDAKVAATGTIRKQAIDIHVEAVRDNGKVALPALKLDVGKNTLSGALTLGPDFLPTGKIDFDLPDVALLAAFAGQKADGTIKGSADFQSQNGKISGAITARGPRLSAGGAEIVKPMVDLKIADLASGQISGKVTADRVASGTNVIARLALDIDHAGTKTAFDLKSLYDASPLTAKGAIEQLPDGLNVSLDSFAAAPKRIPVKLNRPTSFAIKNGTLSLTSLSISAGKGSITLTGNAGKALDLTARVTALPASIANAFAPSLGADGTISATVTAKGDPTAPVVTFDTAWQNAAISQTRSAGLKNFSVTAKGQLARNILTLDANARSGDGLSLRAGGTVAIAGSKALNLKINGQLPFPALGGLLATQGVDLRGNARFDIAVSGSTANPSISGRISTSGATLTLIRQNLTVNGLAATVDLDGKQARVANLSGKLSGGGTLNVSGTIGITPASGFPADLKIALKNAVYTDGKVLAAKLNGDLTVTGSLIRGPTVGGRVDVRRADITIPQKLPGTLAQIQIKHKHPSRAVAIQAARIKENQPGTKTGKDAGGVNFDLTISAPRQIFVRGRGIDAELGGKIMISGNAGAPDVTGGFKMLRGRLSIVGRRLDFTAGQISFGGNLTPAIDMTATSTVEATTVSVIVSGLANNPNVTFSSSPSLPQDEVLALLIFGRNSAELSPVQIAQLADAVSTLAGGQSNSLFNRLRQGLGVDDLDVGTDENGKSNVSVGKYLNKRTYLQLQQDTTDNTTNVIINLDIGKGVKLRGEAGSDASTAGGVFFDKEY